MSIAESEFWSRLVQLGLADQPSCRKFAQDFRKNGGSSQSADPQSLCDYLVGAGKLTPFQAAKFVQADESALRVGSFVMTADQPILPFSYWIPVQTVITEDAPTSRHGFLLRVPLAGLDETRRSWLAIHSEIQSPSLQPVELSGGAQSEGAEQMVEIFSPLPEGGSLLKVLHSNQKLSSRKTVRIGVDLANALQAMHAPAESGLVVAHGAVGADHTWVTPRGNAVLLRDPSCAARPPLADQSASWIQRLESTAQYAAPELADPSAQPTPSSDIYSLGCLLFSLLVGRPAFEGDDDQELFAARNAELPQALRHAAAQGASANPLLRVLVYAMAKDPSARFDSVAAMASALTAAGELIDGKQPIRTDRSPTKRAAKSKLTPEPANRTTDRKNESKPPTALPQETRPPAATDKPAATSPPSVESPPSGSSPSAVQTPPTATPNAGPHVDAQPPVAAQPMNVNSASSSPSEAAHPRLRKRRKRKNRIPILAGMMVLPILLLGLAVALRGRSSEKPPPRPRPKPNLGMNVPRVPDSRRDVADETPKLVNGYEIVDSDRLLWVPPYAADSQSPSLTLLPPGPAAIVSVPLASVVNNQAAKPLTSTFANEVDQLASMVEKRAGVPRDQIARCTAALFPGKNGWPEVALSIELVEPIEIKSISEKWKAFESRTADGAVVYAGEAKDADAYFVGGGEKGKLIGDAGVKRFAVASLERIREVAEIEGGAIPLARNLQTLWDQSSTGADFVALVTPNFLFADGRELLSSSVPEFRPALKQWLIPDVAAFSLSATAKDDAMYVELREIASGGATSATLLKSLRDSMGQWPQWGDDFILGSVPDPSWRLLATRLPMMLRFVSQQTRSTILGETVVASTYLPNDAAAQVALATFLAMNTAPGGDSIAEMPAAKPLTVDEMLDRPMSISFLQLSLQFAVDAVVDEFASSLPKGSTMPAVRIIGNDLEKNGITQNQQISGFERNGQPLREVLTDLVLGANPDKTAQGPDDPKQALVWVVHPQGKPSAETEILITTRDAAKGQYQLPTEFELNAE